MRRYEIFPSCVIFAGMKHAIELFSELGRRMERLGEDAASRKVIARACEANGWFTEESGGTTLNMNKVLDYYGVENEVSFNNSIDDIRECLENGGKVIVSVDADEIWFADDDSIFTPGEATNHAVEVIGIDYSDPDEPMVILNDSGTDNGCVSMVPLDVFVDAWEDGNCHMISCM